MAHKVGLGTFVSWGILSARVSKHSSRAGRPAVGATTEGSGASSARAISISGRETVARGVNGGEGGPGDHLPGSS